MTVPLYLDVCCLFRPFDDQTQDRIRLESETLLLIHSRIQSGEYEWVGSDVLGVEIDRTLDLDRRYAVQLLTRAVQRTISLGDHEKQRAGALKRLGFKDFDAFHLACAEAGNVDVFLTTDDRLLKTAARVSDKLRVRVINPLNWLQEVLDP